MYVEVPALIERTVMVLRMDSVWPSQRLPRNPLDGFATYFDAGRVLRLSLSEITNQR